MTNGGNLRKTNNTVASGKLEKAKLISEESETIEFMFNPSELSFTHSNTFNCDQGSRTASGIPKISFAHPNPSQITISNIRFDTYEQGTNVLEYINLFIKALDFTKKGNDIVKRPPIYTFIWGQNNYLRCFIDTLSYTLTRFLADGTPVQARIDQLTLKEVDGPFGDSNTDFVVDRTHNVRK